jgi:hypothetical protein
MPHYECKLKRSIHDAIHNNPNANEAPYYEVWDIWLNDFILNAKDYTCRPQGVLSINIEPDKRGGGLLNNKRTQTMKRSPDFIVYHNTDTMDENGEYILQRGIAFVAEVKPWAMAMGEDTQVLVNDFGAPEFLEQVRDHGKMIMGKHGMGRIWLMQCLGMFWRVGILKNEDLSPFVKRVRARKSRPRYHGTAIEWWPIQRLGHPDSDIQQKRFWLAMSSDVE